MKKIAPVHPGEILLEEYMKPLGISQNALAKSLKVTPIRINEIVNKKRAITVNTAMRLSRFFGNSAEFWVNLQYKYKLELNRELYEAKIKNEVELFVAS